jgi:hypothetical protein
VQTAASQAEVSERRRDRADREMANEAERAFVDAMRLGDTPAIERSLAILRRVGQPGQYASAAARYYGERELPTTPQMESFVEERLRDRANPLTRDELGRMREERRINETVFRRGLERLAAREEARFREAEAFIERALEVPSVSTPANLYTPTQRQAVRQRNDILNDLVAARAAPGGADIDPLAFVRERLQSQPAALDVVQQNTAQVRLSRMAPELQTPEGLARVEQQWQAYQAAIASRGWFGSTPRPPALSNGVRVTADDLVTWRQLHEQAGLRAPAGATR